MKSLRFDTRKSEGDHYLRIWTHDDERGYWYVARVAVLEEKAMISGALVTGEEEVSEFYWPGESPVYAYPWLRGELKHAKGSGAYIVYDQDIERE